MYAIVEIAGQQFKVEEGRKIFVHRMDAAEGENIEFEKVLLLDNDGVITVGEPVIENTVVEGKVLSHVRGDKVIIFKKKRRKGYQKRSGHRQDFTHVEITNIGARSTAKKNAAPKAEVVVAAAPAAEEVKVVVKKTPVKKAAEKKAPAVKKAPVKKAAEKKAPAEKKAAVKKAPATKSPKKPAKE
ncbi:MAG TPA: 50S ribosomal protein L21 [Bacteroidales bacterium]|nr:50S ribosomal protein L21 [Bacteroidales bacterium]